MTTNFAERAREEAERVEREEAEGADDDEQPTPLEEPEKDGPTEDDLEALDAENTRHMAALREIMGAAFELFEECEFCNGNGIRAGLAAAPHHEAFRTCPTCSGFGQVRTGAQPGPNFTVQCPGCGGRGFQERNAQQQQPAAPAAPAGVAVAQADEWGVPQWMGDPGIRPVSPVPVPPVPAA